jgi:transcriptional regulator with XRE-family HTH domain
MEQTTTDQPTIYPGKQLQLLKDFYRLRVKDIAQRSQTGSNTVNDALQGRGSVDLRKFAAIADVLNADVIVILKPRDPHFIRHVEAMLPTVPAIQ